VSSQRLDLELGQAADRLNDRALLAQAEVESRLFGSTTTAPPLRIAERYRLIEPLGQGGQGEVWRAEDEELGREVAVKRMRLHPGMSLAMLNDARAEAQALGQFQHPNVVSVFDLGLEQGDESAYIVMELVRGSSLDRWVADHSPSVADILKLLRQVAQGLKAAHAIGLVHRDIKPANLLIGDDGRARVADFGLVAMDPEALPSVAEAPGEISEPGPKGPVGTAIYMAPEQMANEEVGPRADLFALAVTLFEVLHGTRPHQGNTVAELLAAKRQGPPPRPNSSPLRAAAYRALARGMAPDPGARFEDVEVFIDAVIRAQGRRIWLPAIVTFVGIASASAAVSLFVADDPGPCTTAASRVETLWNDSRRQELERAFLDTGLGFARSTATRVDQRLDRFTSEWAEARDAACRGAYSNGDGPTLDLAMACYDRELREFAELVEIFSYADEAITRRAISAVAKLPDVARCNDLDSLRSGNAAPDDPRLAARAARAGRDLERARALQLAGKYKESLELASALVIEAQEIGFAPFLVQAKLQRGTGERNLGMVAEAELTLIDTYSLAVEESMPIEAADAASQLVIVIGDGLLRPVEGRAWSRHAEAQATAADAPLLMARSMGNLATLEDTQGNYETARAYREHALTIFERSRGPEHPETIKAIANLGVSESQLGRWDQAEVLYLRALKASEVALGPDHPTVAALLGNLGSTAGQRGDLDSAREFHARALAIAEQTLGLRHADLAIPVVNLGLVAELKGELEIAALHYERALALLEKTTGPDTPRVAKLLDRLAAVAILQGDDDGAERHLKRAHAIITRELEPEHLARARSHASLGDLAFARHAFDEAKDHHERALAIRSTQLGAQHPLTIDSLRDLGRVARAQGDYEHARQYYARALALSEEQDPLHWDVAMALNGLGLVALHQGEYDTARRYHERSLQLRLETFGELDPKVAIALNNLGQVALEAGHHQRAHELYRRALALREKVLPEDHPHRAYSLLGLGNTLIALDRAPEAIPYLERALVINSAADDALELAHTRYALARALIASGSPADRRRALQLASAARETYATDGPRSAAKTIEVSAWLDAR